MYQSFLASLSKRQWERIGTQRRAGVAIPLFSLYSSASVGIGELPDLKLLADWCHACGMSMIQLLPMNDVGFNFTPYDAQSTFALEPMYLSLHHLSGISSAPFKKEIEALRRQFPTGRPRVDYGIKQAKLDLLWKIFQQKKSIRAAAFNKFLEENKFWLEDFVLFKVIKEIHHEAGWEHWEEKYKRRESAAIHRFRDEHAERLKFYEWLQWQLFEQFTKVKQYCAAKGILLMGDLPFLVSRDSAEVWAHQNYFKLHLSSGAPPDMYFAKGQRWGMPPYDWPQIAAHHYDYLKEKLKYAQNFYDLFRIDHVVGIFRVWTIDLAELPENGGLNGKFDPLDENLWEEQGRRLLSFMIQNTEMIPCAEDLGVVPECSNRVLEEFGILGLDVQRWNKNWKEGAFFKKPQDYRKNSIAVISSHDMSSLRGWWEFEVGTVDGALFKRLTEAKGIPYETLTTELFDLSHSHHGRMRWKKEIHSVPVLLSILRRQEHEVWDLVDLYKGSFGEKEKFLNYLYEGEVPREPVSSSVSAEFIRRVLEKVQESASIFSIQLLQDWLSLDPNFKYDPWNFRINFPGTMGEHNWTLVVPVSLEKMLKLAINEEIKEISTLTGRI